ncbi:MAG: hypothetical protein J6N52_03725 [Clostridia bacterium]|nr:hypothetical protein [Clostridia bacterium]
MAKKNKNELQYLQMPLPAASKSSVYVKINWSSLNKRQTHDTGALTAESNICTSEAPQLTPARSWKYFYSKNVNNESELIYLKSNTGVSSIATEFFVNRSRMVIVRENLIKEKIRNINYSFQLLTNSDKNLFEKMDISFKELESIICLGDYIFLFYVLEGHPSGRGVCITRIYQGDKANSVTDCMIFGEFTNENTPPGECTTCIKYPIVYSMYQTGSTISEIRPYKGFWLFDGHEKSSIDALSINVDKLAFSSHIYAQDGVSISPVPLKQIPVGIKSCTEHLTRIIAVTDEFVYVGNYNSPGDWVLDVDTTNASNAWVSTTTGNPSVMGKFTAVTSYNGKAVCFHENYMQEIYGTKNPFRIIDIGEYGCLGQKSLCEINGILYFASRNGIYSYNGASIKLISYEICAENIKNAVLGSFEGTLFAYCEQTNSEKHFYTYDTSIGVWSERSLIFGENESESGKPKEFVPKMFTSSEEYMYMLTEAGEVYVLSDNYDIDWHFETDIITAKTADIKHISKLQMLVYASEGSEFDAYILYDDEIFDKNTSHHVFSSKGRTGKFPVRVKPRMTAGYGFKLHVEGYGFVRIYELEMKITGGGELFR